MKAPEIRFDDGAAYERMMGIWSQLAGSNFLEWLAPTKGLDWIDVGCGNGAFTELVSRECLPNTIRGIDPSQGQLSYARQRIADQSVTFETGSAELLNFGDRHFDIAVMALVIFFVGDPARGVSEMRRVVRAGGTVCAYAWDIMGGGFPLEPIQSAMRELGLQPARPPSFEVSRIDALRTTWENAGLSEIETCELQSRGNLPISTTIGIRVC